MPAVKKFFMITFGVAILLGALLIFVNYYSFIFSRRVVGVVQKVERVQVNVALMQTQPGQGLSPQLYSFAVAIKDKETGEIVTASAEDRQWAVVEAGKCAEAVFYPYPPWKLDKANTYFNARLEKLFDCPAEAAK